MPITGESRATRKLCSGTNFNDAGPKSACRKSHQKLPRDALVSTNGVVPGWSADGKQSTSAVTTTVNSLLSNAPPFLPFFCIGPKLRFIRSTPIASESMSQNDLKFREHGCELPANAMFEHTNTRYPQALRCVRLPSELREPIEKSACLATIVRATAYLAGLGQRDIAAGKQ